ncbi:MAG TPA: alpha/beta hydrolase [Polyangiaceae bacterium]|nr:alpha/beta hydrolase [Polyangiaceae bacterium]
MAVALTTLVENVDVGEVRLRCTIAGPGSPAAEGGENARSAPGPGAAPPLVILLHGFPECASSWDGVQRALAGKGYRVVAPDMRGYGGSDKPEGVEAYEVRRLVGDVAGLVRAFGATRAHIVGHDWGGVVAWWTAMTQPEVVDRLAIVNAPHPAGYAAALRTWGQLRRAWYVFFFQVPWLPERLLGWRDLAAVRRTFSADKIPDRRIADCVDAMRSFPSRAAAVGYYRAGFRGTVFNTQPAFQKIDRPTLVLWGERDRFLIPSLAEPPPEWVPDARTVRLPEASHWAPIDAPARVADELHRHFSG